MFPVDCSFGASVNPAAVNSEVSSNSSSSYARDLSNTNISLAGEEKPKLNKTRDVLPETSLRVLASGLESIPHRPKFSIQGPGNGGMWKMLIVPVALLGFACGGKRRYTRELKQLANILPLSDHFSSQEALYALNFSTYPGISGRRGA